MLFECNLVGNPKEWWIDSRDTRHICVVKEAFATYSIAGPEEELSIKNTATTKIEGCGKIFLKMTSGKVLMLNNVLHVPTIRKNLVSTSLLVKNRFKCVFVSEKVIVRKNDMYVGKGYLTEVLSKLNVKVVDSINKISSSSYLLESNDLCIYSYKTECESLSERLKRPHREPKKNTPSEEDPRRSKCQKTSTSFRPNFVTFLLENESQTFKAAMSSSDSTLWKEAVNSEIQLILDNHTSELLDLPTGNKPLGLKSIFKWKMVLVELAAVYGLEIHQMDVKTIFLNSELEEEIYMEQPESFVVPCKNGKCANLLSHFMDLNKHPNNGMPNLTK
ncbi:uncharacterized protein [Nicotiana tomentosiformis]|uniref:uncharacterized protein n=1 Tax=Nicotiana tomentosiformis TaxID=4098 RepID=UPI00388CEB86